MFPGTVPETTSIVVSCEDLQQKLVRRNRIFSLDEMGRLFGEDFALDIRQLCPEATEALDRELASA